MKQPQFGLDQRILAPGQARRLPQVPEELEVISQADIDAAQQHLEDVIESAKAQGKTFRTSAPWAAALGRVATLRRQYARQQELSRPDPGSHTIPTFLHSV